MSEIVNGLRNRADLGTWRGHDVVYDIDANGFYSESAGVTGKTLAEIKRLIDEKAKKKYVPYDAIAIGTYGGMSGQKAVVIAPADSRHVWVMIDGSRQKRPVSDLTKDTQQARAAVNEAKSLRDEADKLRGMAARLLQDLPHVTPPEEV